MLPKSVGQDEKVLEESDRPASLTIDMDNLTNSGKIVETCTYSVEKLSVVLNIEYMNKPLVKGSSSVHEETKNGVGSANQFDIREVSENNKDEKAGNVDINADSQKKVETCSSAEGCEAESNKDVLTDAVASVESRNLAGDDGVEPLNLADKPQISFSDTKSIQLSQSANNKLEVNGSAGQNHSLSMNMKVSSVSSHGSQLDPINHLKAKTPTRRSRKVGKSSPSLTPPGQVTPVSNPMPGGMTPISISNPHDLDNSTSIFHHSFTDYQHVELRAQILVYGSLLSGMPPEEPHMIAAFGQSDDGTRAWEATWHAYLERVCCQMSQPNNPGSSTPDQGIKFGSAQSNFLSGICSPVVNPMIPISSPLWNIPTPYLSGSNPMWLSQSPFLGQWFASSPVAPFNARFPAMPITEPVKLTTVKESGAPSMPVIPAGPSAGPAISQMVSPGQPSSDPNGRKRKKVVDSQFTTSAALSPPVSINSKSIPDNFNSTISPAPNGQSKRVDQNTEKIVTQEEIVSKIEESKIQAADAAMHAAAAVDHCENVWCQLESQKISGLVSDDEAKLASSAVSVAAAVSVAKVAAAAAKIASNVAEQARLMGDEVFLSKHAENLDAIVKVAELATEAVSLAGKIVAVGNPMSLRELVEAGPEGLFNQEGYSDKQNIEIAETVGVISESEFGLVPSSKVDQNTPQRTSGIGKYDIIKESCLVEVLKDNNKEKHAWFAANVLTLKDGKAYVCYTEIQSDDGSGKLKEWVPLEVEGDDPPRLRMAHVMTTMRFEGTRKRNRTALTDYAWCSGDQIDVWIQDCWCEAVVVETNKNDLTSLTVQFPAQGKTSVVRSWHVRPTLIWKDGKWIEWSSMKGSHSSEGDMPHEKRQKFGTPVVEVKPKPELSKSINLVKSTRSGLLRQQSRVVFGVPKPGKNQKFMDVSTHHVNIPNSQNNMPRVSKNKSKNSLKEEQVVEVKSKAIKTRKPPIPSFKTLTRKVKSKPSKPTDENLSGQPNMMDVDSYNADDMIKTSTSKTVGKTAAKVEVNKKSTLEVETRRSVRRIQPTSRLLEGLQSSLTFTCKSKKPQQGYIER